MQAQVFYKMVSLEHNRKRIRTKQLLTILRVPIPILIINP